MAVFSTLCSVLIQQLLANQEKADIGTRVLGWESVGFAGREMGAIVGWMLWQGGELLVPCTDPIPC